MDFERIGVLVRLRYRLLWAHTRTRNGKIALFFAGYLLIVMVMALFGAGGVSAGMVAIRSGKGPLLAGAILTGVFMQGLLASVILGFGMTTIFSDTELRRFPLRAAERRLTQHFIGMADPFWILFFVLDLAIALGLFLFGVGTVTYGLVAVVLLFVCNYLAARVLAILVSRLAGKKFGSMIMLLLVIGLGLLPATLQPVLAKHPEIVRSLRRVWEATPPAAAGVAMTTPDFSAIQSLGVIALWAAALLALLTLLERMPQKTVAVHNSKLVWGDLMDRIGALYGPKVGPLVAHWLRFYWRNNRFRTIYPLALPLAAFLMFFFTRQDARGGAFGGPFPVAVTVFGMIGFIGTGQFAVNQFGYVGGGFRRFLLLPTDPAAAFRAGSYTFLSLSGVLILPAAVLWMVFGPIPSTPKLLTMLVSCSVASLLFFNGMSLWTSILGARRGNFKQALGNDLSLAGNVLVLGGSLGWLFLPRFLITGNAGEIVRDYWWTTPLLALVMLSFYLISLRLTSALFLRKREDLMSLMEGKG